MMQHAVMKFSSGRIHSWSDRPATVHGDKQLSGSLSCNQLMYFQRTSQISSTAVSNSEKNHASLPVRQSSLKGNEKECKKESTVDKEDRDKDSGLGSKPKGCEASKLNPKKLTDQSSGPSKPPVMPAPLVGTRVPNPAACRYIHCYVISGTNGVKFVSDVLDSWRWHRLADKKSTAFTLKWSDLRQSIDFHSFREGEQMVNHYPNSTMLTTKIGLLESLRQHNCMLLSLRLHVNQIIPETYRMDVPAERDEFFQTYKADEMWICKPTGANQGKGIFLIKTLQQIQEKLEADERHCSLSRRPTPRIVQRYISSPLLLEGRKFDIRVYMMLVSADRGRLLAFYHHGYIRLSCLSYDTDSSDLTVHLTNQYVQKKHPSYEDIKDDTVWDFDKFQAYLSEHEKLPDDWVRNNLTSQIKRIMLGCHHCVCQRLEQRIGYFELFGFDFMVDSNHHVWLIEVNVNPAMHTNCDTLNQIIPNLLKETLGIAIEVWSKSRRSKPIFPIEAQKSYETLYPLQHK